jgi:CHAD domain-containing protein
LAGSLAAHRQQSLKLLLNTLETGQSTPLLLDVWAWLAEKPMKLTSASKLTLAEFAKQRFAKWLKAMLKKGKQLEIANEADLHQFRIQGKKLRYGLEFLRPILGDAVQSLIERLKELQDSLGYLHDAQRTETILQEILTGTTSRIVYRETGIFIGWQSRDVLETRQHLRKQWRNFQRSGRKWLQDISKS